MYKRQIRYCGCELVPMIEPVSGTVGFVDEKQIMPVADEIRKSGYFKYCARKMASGGRYYVIKDGMVVRGAVLPVKPVSYTHLIQKPDGSYQYRATDLLGHGEAYVINIQHWIHPVSYTHLDVYKRQGAVFFASGVFYYFLTEQVKALVQGMADACLLYTSRCV